MAKLDTKTARHEQLVPEQQAVSEALFTSIGDGAISTDEFGKITRINPVALGILGYTESELVGEWFPKKIIALGMDGTPVNLIDRPITKAFLTGKSISEKMFYIKNDGQRLPVSISVSPILLEGRPLGAIEVFRDITLEEEVDRMKSEFISLASHQLRTPLSAIKTYSHMLEEGYMGEVTDAQRKSLRTIITAADRMNELISTLLNITRIESGSIAVVKRDLDIKLVLEEVLKEVALLASEKEVALTLQLSPRANLTVQTDLLIVKEVVTNIITNAIKYTPEGGKVKVMARPKGDSVLVAVEDTGWGIPKHSHDQIFSKFFRADNIIKRETTGTGLGLYLVKGLMDALGGRIWFESDEGKGTTFFITVPRPDRKLRQAVGEQSALTGSQSSDM